MKSTTTLSVAAALLSGSAEAFWRMPCHSRTAFLRLDPIVDPGVASSHGHVIHGGSSKSTRPADSFDPLHEWGCYFGIHAIQGIPGYFSVTLACLRLQLSQ